MRALLAVAALLLTFLQSNALAAEKASAQEAVAMVQRAVALIRSAGKEAAFAAIADPANRAFHDRDLYIYVYDLHGVALAHGNNPKIAGTPRINMRDNEGRAMIKVMVDIAKTRGKGWVDFKWPNPVTREIELKSGYIERIDDMLVGSGIYR
jgi:cytochrome c